MKQPLTILIATALLLFHAIVYAGSIDYLYTATPLIVSVILNVWLLNSKG